MTNLTTNYLGFELRTPLVASASTLSFDLDTIKRMEDAGISAIVLYSLFEEELEEEDFQRKHYIQAKQNMPATSFGVLTERYLEHIRKVKESVNIPIIASLNGCTPGGWTEIASLIQAAGADAIELNLYEVPTDMNTTGREMEEDYYETFWQVRTKVTIPLALKLSPFFSNLTYNAKRFDEMGANALVLFNRFYQPDIDIENLRIKQQMSLSSAQDIFLPLRWIALLYGRVKCNLAGTSGIYTATDVIKLIMAGASITMLCSILLRKGIGEIKVIEKEIVSWMEKYEYGSISEVLGKMSQIHYPKQYGLERLEYLKTLHSLKM
ncbi:MAG: dihydroorotate dehydrogenase-like protein [Leptospiraceae bacterium]|nr:dihydroorotate dehydrogenase-like protein [Leptospiraceae bacterium]